MVIWKIFMAVRNLMEHENNYIWNYKYSNISTDFTYRFVEITPLDLTSNYDKLWGDEALDCNS